ncbi:ARID DNA-binding domain-containing protein [Tanacetum coccineum]
MEKSNSSYGKWQKPLRYSNGIFNKWHQSKILGKPLRRTPKFEFEQRKIKRDEEERIGKCIRQITKGCKDMLKKKIEEIEVHNSANSQSKYKEYDCFYCNQKGHIFKSCPTKTRDEASYAQGHTVGIAEGSMEVNNITHAKINKNKGMVMCFKCQKHGHFANRCPSRNQEASSKEHGQPKVSIKYLEFIHFKTRGIIKGTDNGTWDNIWYVSNTTNKHSTSNLNFFTNLKEEFLVEKLEGQRKLLFTYGIGEVLIKDGNNGYLIPGVHYAPEITLNILSINLLKQQGFEIIFEGDRCILEYMFKDQQGQNMDVDKMRQRHNDYLDDYFESMDKERTEREREMPRLVEDTNASEIHTFQEFVAFLNLIKKDGMISKDWDIYRKIFDKVLTCVHFGQEFGALAEILRLTRSDGEEIRKCYMTYLEVFVSYYKTARAPEDPMRGGED